MDIKFIIIFALKKGEEQEKKRRIKKTEESGKGEKKEK